MSQKLNCNVRSLDLSYTLEVNEFAAMTQDEFAREKMASPDSFPVHSDIPLGNEHYMRNDSLEDFPSDLSWVERGAVNSPIPQGLCGSCYAIGTLGALEAACWAKTGTLPKLSVQQIVDCSREEGNLGCVKGSSGITLRYIIKYGIVSDEDYPYEAKEQQCKNDVVSDKTKQYLKPRTLRVDDVVQVAANDLRSLFVQLQKSPIVIMVDASEPEWQAYKGGILECNQLTSALRSLQKAATSFDDEDDEALEECLKEIAKALLQADVNVKYVSNLRQSIRTHMKLYEGTAINRHKTVRKLVFDELVNLLTPSRPARKLTKGRSNVVMFVGLQGSGKTTSCTKYALYHQRRGWKVALVCADTFRAGAFDQLRQNATKARIPFYGSHTVTDPVQVASEGVDLFKEERYDLIIVDTSGRHEQASALFDEMRQISDAVKPDDVVFVMDSHIGQACSAQASAFSSAVDVGSVIITKLDGHAKGGGALSAVAATNSPIIFIGTGEHLDDFEKFEVKGFVGRLLGMGDLAGLADSIASAVNIDEQKETMERLQAGKAFTLRDLYSQLQAVMNMGSMSKMLSMIPGMGGSLPTGSDEASIKRIKGFLVMMDSLTSAEMDSVKPITEGSRIMRVARGSGHHPYAVIELVEEHKRMQKMLQRMGKSGLLSKAGDLTNMVRNPQQVIRQGKALELVNSKAGVVLCLAFEGTGESRRSAAFLLGSLVCFVGAVQGGGNFSPDRTGDAIADQCNHVDFTGDHLVRAQLAKAVSTREHPYALWTVGEDRGAFARHSCERVVGSPRRNKDMQYEVLTKCDGLPTTAYFPDEEGAVDFAVQWGHLHKYDVDSEVLGDGWVDKNPFSRFAVFKKKLSAAYVEYDANQKPSKRALKIGTKTRVQCDEVTSGPTGYSDKWKVLVTCTKEKSKQTRTFDVEFKDKTSAMSFATIWGGYATEVPMSSKMIKGSNIKAAELLVSPATGRARKRVLKLEDDVPRICRAVTDVVYKEDGVAADVIAQCDGDDLTIPFTAYQRAERFAARWGGFKKVDEDIVKSCRKMDIAGHSGELVRATADVASMGRKVIAGRLEALDGSKLRCDRVSEPVIYEADTDKFAVVTKCQDRTTRIVCDDEDSAWRFSAQWSNFRAGISVNLGLVSASTRVDVNHNDKLFPFTLATANIESHVKTPSVRMRWLGLHYAGTSPKDDVELSRQWFLCSKVKTIREAENGEFQVMTVCGLSIRNRTPTPEHRDNEVAVVFAKREQAEEFAIQWGQYNPMHTHDVGAIYNTDPLVDVQTAAYYRDSFSGQRSGRTFTTRDASYDCGALTGMEHQVNGNVYIYTKCSGQRNKEDLPSAETQLVLMRAETAVKWAVKWGGDATPEIHMSSDIISDATASVQGQVSGSVAVAKLVYASSGTLDKRFLELSDGSGKSFVYTCEGVSPEISVHGESYTVKALCGTSTVEITFPSEKLGVAFARYFGGLHSASVDSDSEFIGSCRNVVIGTAGGVHELKHARLREELGTGELKRLLVVQGEQQELSCSPVTNPPEFDEGVYKLTVVCGAKPVTITCTESDSAVLFATRWGAYPYSELGVKLSSGVCSNARLDGDAGWMVKRQTVAITGTTRSFMVEKGGVSRRVECNGLTNNPQVGLGEIEISIDCHDSAVHGKPLKLELLCLSPPDAVQVCKGPLFEKNDAIVEISSHVRLACDVVTVSGQSDVMQVASASIQDSAVVVEISGLGQSNTRQFSCSHLLGPPETTDHQTLMLHAQCEGEVLNFECKDPAAALQLASWGQIEQPAIALQQEVVSSCPEVRQQGISNGFSLTRATYKPSFVKQSGGEQKRWLTITLRNEEPSYEDSDFSLACSAVASTPEPFVTLNRDVEKYKVIVECDGAEGMGGSTKVEVLCDDFHNAMQLATTWGSLETSHAAMIELTTLHTHLKAAWLDGAQVDTNKVHMFVARPKNTEAHGSSFLQVQESLEGNMLQIGTISYKCDSNAQHRVYFKQFFYYVTMQCNEYAPDKTSLEGSHKVTLIANTEEGALTVAKAFAGMRVDKVWIDHTLYFAGEEGVTKISDTNADLTQAYINVFPREYILDFNGAFQYSCIEASQAPRYTTDNMYQVSLTCGKRVEDSEPEQKDQVVTVGFSTPVKAIGFSNGFGGLLYHEVDFDPKITHTVNYIAPLPEQHMGREEIFPLKRATVKFDLTGRLVSRRLEFLRADHFYGSDNGERTYHAVKFECDEKLTLDRKSDKSGNLIATTLTATCVETYGGFHQQHGDKVKVLLAFLRFPDAAEHFMSWWRGNFKPVAVQEDSPINSAQASGWLKDIRYLLG
ncbi:hypothetical protein FOL47_009933 [Perkinsus chesapeaki]|uniref:signal-recognition-particle GTPase n=1 Tax=Perkinsus chesapeaki TaxID=330153 RepID=A0A7J6L5L4_PERCH|nr:hypothetical protein FOL47_009933 [Perkinsus chesapeaki]